MVMLQNSSFIEAKNYFQDFLIQEGLSKNILWVFREDIIPQKKGVLIKTPLPPENEDFVERCYEKGRKRGLGVCFHNFALLNSHPCCFIELPMDDIDAGYMMMSDVYLKCSKNTNLLNAKAVHNPLTWAIYKFHSRMFVNNIYYPSHMLDRQQCL